VIRRNVRERLRDATVAMGWVFVASPLIFLVFGSRGRSALEMASIPIVGVLLLVWVRRHPARYAEHVAAVEHVQPDDYDGPDALTTPFYLAWCDCGWNGDDQASEDAARREAREHTRHVRDGLHAFGEPGLEPVRAERD